MADLWLAPDQLFDGERLHAGLGIRLASGRVAEIAKAPPGARPLKGTITPGFLDLQVNGGGDVLLNADPSAAGIARILAAHRRFGTVGVMPTVITDAPEVLEAAAEAALAARDQPGMLGLHIEGPHISMPRRGTHAARYVRPLSAETIALVTRLRAAGLAVMITVAPEATDAAGIAALAATGAIVSLGHSDATAEEVRGALEAGARCFTHLFNAMSPMLNRAPGVVGAAINSEAHAGIIVDGVHVADEMVALALRARPVADRMFLVSDAMPTVGGRPSFTLYGEEIRVEDGRLVNHEGSLAGAHVTIADSLARLVTRIGLAPEAALRMAVTVPAGLIGAPALAGLLGRAAEDVLLLAPDWRYAGNLGEIAAPSPASQPGR
ncbi:N-acetylglucosamine-6-phosphate deacetylase [Pseudoroseicyclus sp. CXY001]|uniref:N-acetylglucosamine-6-phosphate deacetylase n=1 Tax=Pseudoroseicyclus sp. CXY001 TaxID=3242492 RepID=UPI0035710059